MIYSDEAVADSYDKDRFTSSSGLLFDSIEREIVRSVALELPATVIALDAGTGTGRFAMMLSRFGFCVIGADISLPMLSRAREKAVRSHSVNVNLIRGTIFRLPIRTETTDLIVSLRVLSQLGSQAAQMEAVRELCRICAPGGRIVFDVINRNSLAIFSRFGNGSLMSLQSLEREIKRIRGIRVNRVVGRLAVTQTAYRVCPQSLLSALLRFDRLVCDRLPQIGTRAYYILAKS